MQQSPIDTPLSADSPRNRAERWVVRSGLTDLLEPTLNEAAAEGFRLVSTGVAATSPGADELVIELACGPRPPSSQVVYRVVTGGSSADLSACLEHERSNGYDVLSVNVVSTRPGRQAFVAVCERSAREM